MEEKKRDLIIGFLLSIFIFDDFEFIENKLILTIKNKDKRLLREFLRTISNLTNEDFYFKTNGQNKVFLICRTSQTIFSNLIEKIKLIVADINQSSFAE